MVAARPFRHATRPDPSSLQSRWSGFDSTFAASTAPDGGLFRGYRTHSRAVDLLHDEFGVVPRSWPLCTRRQEGALKLMELAYILLAYPAGEMKHGPMPCSRGQPCGCGGPQRSPQREDHVGPARMKARAQMILIHEKGDSIAAEGDVPSQSLRLPVADPLLTVFTSTDGLRNGPRLGRDVDRPRNLPSP